MGKSQTASGARLGLGAFRLHINIALSLLELRGGARRDRTDRRTAEGGCNRRFTHTHPRVRAISVNGRPATGQREWCMGDLYWPVSLMKVI